jgi:hypothetical protein
VTILHRYMFALEMVYSSEQIPFIDTFTLQSFAAGVSINTFSRFRPFVLRPRLMQHGVSRCADLYPDLLHVLNCLSPSLDGLDPSNDCRVLLRT